MGILDLQKLGLDAATVLAVVFLTFMLKLLDKRNRFKPGYVLFPLIASMIVCYLHGPFEWRKWVQDSLIYAAIAAYGYDLYANTVKPKITRKR